MQENKKKIKVESSSKHLPFFFKKVLFKKRRRCKFTGRVLALDVYLNIKKNNIFMSVANIRGDTLMWMSAGNIKSARIKKFNRKTPFAAIAVGKAINLFLQKIRKYKIRYLKYNMVGRSRHFFKVKKCLVKRDRRLYSASRRIRICYGSLDTVSVPYNGCRLPKRRRK